MVSFSPAKAVVLEVEAVLGHYPAFQLPLLPPNVKSAPKVTKGSVGLENPIPS